MSRSLARRRRSCCFDRWQLFDRPLLSSCRLRRTRRRRAPEAAMKPDSDRQAWVRRSYQGTSTRAIERVNRRGKVRCSRPQSARCARRRGSDRSVRRTRTRCPSKADTATVARCNARVDRPSRSAASARSCRARPPGIARWRNLRTFDSTKCTILRGEPKPDGSRLRMRCRRSSRRSRTRARGSWGTRRESVRSYRAHRPRRTSRLRHTHRTRRGRMSCRRRVLRSSRHPIRTTLIRKTLCWTTSSRRCSCCPS